MIELTPSSASDADECASAGAESAPSVQLMGWEFVWN